MLWAGTPCPSPIQSWGTAEEHLKAGRKKEKVFLAGDRRLRHEGNRDGKCGLDFCLVEIDKAIKISCTNKFKTYSRDDESSSFNFISFLNSSGEDANQYAEGNKNHLEFCYPEKSSLNIVMCFLPFIFLHIWLG